MLQLVSVFCIDLLFDRISNTCIYILWLTSVRKNPEKINEIFNIYTFTRKVIEINYMYCARYWKDVADLACLVYYEKT